MMNDFMLPRNGSCVEYCNCLKDQNFRTEGVVLRTFTGEEVALPA